MTPLTRRALLSTAAAGFVMSTQTARTSNANSRVTFGVIGLGRRGKYAPSSNRIATASTP